MTALLRDRHAPPAVMHAAVDHIPEGTTRGMLAAHALLANPTCPLDVIDRIFARCAHDAGHTLRGELASGMPLGEVLAGFPAAASHTLAVGLDGMPDPDGHIARAQMAMSPTALQADRSDLRIGRAWRNRWVRIAADEAVPDDVRLDAALHAASSGMANESALRKLLEVATDHPDWVGALIECARGHDLAGPLRDLGRERRSVEDVLGVLRSNPTRDYTYRVLRTCGPERHTAARLAADDPTMPHEVRVQIASHDALPTPVRLAAAASLDLHRCSGIELSHLTDLITAPDAPAELQIAHQRSNRWRHAERLAAQRRPDPRTVHALLEWTRNEGAAHRVRPGAALVALALNPDVEGVHRLRAARLAADLDSAPVVQELLSAAAQLPDRVAAGGALPLPALALTNGYASSARRLLAAGVSARTALVADPGSANVLVRLAPTFAGTVEELFATSVAIGR